MKTGEYRKTNIFMWVIYPTGLMAFIIVMLFACTSSNAKNNQGSTQINDTIRKKEIVLPVIPSELTIAQERANYLVNHYWDNFDFADTAFIHLPEITEQAFANYIEILTHADKATSYFSMNDMLLKSEKASNLMYGYFLDMYKKYLYDPNSPLRNEEYYIPVLNHVIKSDNTGETDWERAEFTLSLMLKNRVGQSASNITYTLESGKTKRLYDTHAQYTLLYFYNPDCSACEQLTNYLKESDLIEKLVNNKILSILMVYPDKDLDIWRKHLSNIPETWINGYDKSTTIIDKQIYDLKAIPTLYLLNKDKKVILKDADVEKVINYLRTNTSFSVMDFN